MRRLMVAAAAGGLLAVAIPGAAGSAQATEVLDNLTCTGPVTLTFKNPVTDAAVSNSYTVEGTLNDCYSAAGTNSNVDHGTISSVGTGTFSCLSYHPFSGAATFTWYDADNVALGRTTVSFRGGEKGNSGGSEVTNDETGITDVTSTLLPLNSYQGSFDLSGITGSCDTGVTALTGNHEVDFGLASL
ncbi:hypothetical protein [Kitasatospora sp. NBC_01300]|uniref:hypothetical protein n=1 Tax=Kitasatospora sp. NBC_01300 TaxID=2903574 RepID=UPI002F91B539|nr:hypothetical protein OG556_35800 [Kitasatospora sp. NBC_01300]